MPTYWTKELPDQAVYLSNGKAFKFDFLATEDSWLINELTNAAKNGVGGVMSITQEQYDAGLSKKNSEPTSPPSWPRQANTISPLQFQPAVPRAGAVVKEQRVMPDPITPVDPKVFIALKPKVAKINKS